MKCKDPILCYQNGNEKQFRHFSLANAVFKLKHNLVFDCRKCPLCRKKQSYELAMRCVLNASLFRENCFVTLTYGEITNEQCEYAHIQKFKKDLRRYCEYWMGKQIQIFNVHEYGSQGRKHWHLVIFGHDFSHDIVRGEPVEKYLSGKYYNSEKLNQLWKHGFHSIGEVTEASAMYQAQYMQKDFKHGNNNNWRKSRSQHSAIGRDYFLKHYKQILELGYIPFGGKKVPIPRYFIKLAHKHYSHFHEPNNFIDFVDRKKLYAPFKPGQAKEDMAQLYVKYHTEKQIRIEQLREEWEAQIEDYIYSKEKPEFMRAAENYLYDLQNKTNLQTF